MFCPRCKEEMNPVYSKDVIRLLGKICRVIKSGQLAEATPREWLCDKCKIIWRIEAKGVLADAEQEIIERYFPEYKLVEG